MDSYASGETKAQKGLNICPRPHSLVEEMELIPRALVLEGLGSWTQGF